ncbi:DNA replication licensing factor mcm8 [Chamberlinius hualienensis]
MASGNRNFRNGRGGKPWFRGRGTFRKKQFITRKSHDSESSEVSELVNSQPKISSLLPQSNCPYKGWRLYFNDGNYREQHPALEMIQLFENYFLDNWQCFKLDDICDRGSFTVDVEELLSDLNVKVKLPDLRNNLIINPEPIIRNLGIAMHQLISLEQEKKQLQTSVVDDDDDETPWINEISQMEKIRNIKRIHARVVNIGCRLPLCELKAIYIGKLVTINGTVVRVSDISPMVMKMPFKCGTCGIIQTVVFPEGKFTIPTSCTTRECRGRTFIPEDKSNLIETVDWQTIKIQEINDNSSDVGRVPRTVECEVHNDLVDSCVPGDIVNVTGIIKVSNCVDNSSRSNQDKCIFLLYIEANSICNIKGDVGNAPTTKNGLKAAGSIGMEFSQRDFSAIREIHEQDNLFRLIVHSLCPAIYGHEMIKAGLVLALFGGTQRFTKDEYRMPNRSNSHVLVVGDPGLGKSQMLKACANVSPRGVYVCGSTTTTAGLTVTLSKDVNGDSSLEAGALVFSDMGCCCVDEFDKMGQQQHALLEAMEQQTISIAKAGMSCTLPARTSILAAANPAEGHYNKAKTVSENLKISGALLSRFDLVFILMDKPDEEIDNRLTEHLIALHGNGGNQNNTIKQKIPVQNQIELDGDNSLSERLRLKAGDVIDPIPHSLLKKYIGYARQYVNPKLSPSAAKILQQFYIELRKNNDTIPITTRQLESLIRLSEARAKLELREEVTEEDAKDVVEIMKYSMMDTYSDEHGFLDFTRSQNGSGMSNRSMTMKLFQVLTKEAKRTNNSLFTVQSIRDITKEYNLQVTDLNVLLDSLNQHNYLLQKGPRIYQLQNL